MREKLIVALDVDNLKKAKVLVDKLYPFIKIFKVGSELFTACGPQAIEMLHKKKAKVFLDLKFHDIPNTVASAVKMARGMGVFMLNVHALGGKQMLKASVSAKGKGKSPILLAVTVLTSMDTGELRRTGIKKSPLAQVKALAFLARSTGVDGVVCSAKEIKTIRKACGKNFIIVTPGIRPAGSKSQDQKRVVTPERAISDGADYLVVGRPITEARDPLAAAKAIISKI
ncbi:MAG: orotidine-5'-phosphate decarboxylase [Candidatus Omnitrophota bacterium]